jgi:hypothetical protein
VLRECHRTLRSGGLVAGFTIAVAPGIGSEDVAMAIELGPAAVAAPASYRDLWDGAGFDLEIFEDVSEEFSRVAEARLSGWERHWSDLTEDVESWEEDLDRIRRARKAAESGLLVRYFMVARKR